jgi:hypothetical protein
MHTQAAFERPDSILNRLATTEALADPMCSRSEWIFSFHEAVTPQKKLFLRSNDTSVLAFSSWVHPIIGPLLEPVEAHWFFAAPLMGPDCISLLDDLLQEPEQRRRRPYVAISGLQPDGALLENLLLLMGADHEVGCLEPIVFRSASLKDGCDGFLSRRSGKFRKNLRLAQKRAKDDGITFERCLPKSDEAANFAYDRMLAIEARSWKGLENCGMCEEPYSTFYRLVYKRMCRSGTARAMFARREGEDIGFVMGGVNGVHYRGQQFSYRLDWAEHSVGNLLQWEQIQWLCEEKIARYDMGSVLDYKLHWTELELRSHTLIWRPNR